MTTDTKAPTLTDLAHALAILEWHFLRVTVAILIGLLPFALAAINTSGRIVAGVWGLVYLVAVLATMRTYISLIWDGLRVAFGGEPHFLPLFERAFEENKDKIEQARAVIPRPIIWLIDFLQIVNPLSVTAMVATLYISLRPTALAHPPGEAHLGRSDVMAYYEARKATQNFEPRELLPVGP